MCIIKFFINDLHCGYTSFQFDEQTYVKPELMLYGEGDSVEFVKQCYDPENESKEESTNSKDSII